MYFFSQCCFPYSIQTKNLQKLEIKHNSDSIGLKGMSNMTVLKELLLSMTDAVLMWNQFGVWSTNPMATSRGVFSVFDTQSRPRHFKLLNV